MDKFQEALMCKTLAPLRGESFEKGKKAEVGEVREWKGQKMRKTSTGWVPATEGKQKSNQEETSTETKEQPQDLATLARSASDSALKVAAQGPNEEVRIAAKRELERRKSEGSDVFEAPKMEETFTKTPKEKKTEETSKAKLDPTQSIKDMYMDDGDLVSVASCFHWLDELDWKKMNWTQYASAIHEINPDVDVTLAKNRYAKVMAAMADGGREKTLEIIKSIVKDQSELGDYDIIEERSADSNKKLSSKDPSSKERSADSNKKLSSKDPSSKEGVEEFLKANFFRTILGTKVDLDLEYTITENLETGKLVVSSNRDIGCGKNVTSLNNNGAFEWGNIKGRFDCVGCTSLTSLEGAPKEVGGSFNCSDCTSLTSLEGAPKEVGGSFNCSGCTSLTSLEGAPKEVGGNFGCVDCTSLTSLEGAPKEVDGEFGCSGCTSLTSLEGAPEKVNGYFNCVGCTSLTSLEGAPKEVKDSFNCISCTSLTSLKGAPERVGGYFDCFGCTSLTSLEGAPKEVDGDFDCYGCTSLTSLEGAPKEVKGRFNCGNVGKTFKPSEIRKICNVGGKIKLK